MKAWISCLFILAFLPGFSQSFKQAQQRYPRVRAAYANHYHQIEQILKQNQISTDQLRLYLRAFKMEKQIELWALTRSSGKYQLLKTYEVCKLSGTLGPKRRQGDLQIPEGFYHIDRFNPASSFHLSLGVNYPNKSDVLLGDPSKLGGDIFIHGACVTIGCLPIRDQYIEELYVFCVEAKNSGQRKIPVTIFPSRLTDSEYQRLQNIYGNSHVNLNLWSSLKKGYEYFNQTKQLPTIEFSNNGRYIVKP